MPRVLEHSGAAPSARTEPEQLRLFEGGIDLAELRRERAELAARSRARSTVVAYASGWRDFVAWCVAAGRSSLPASPDTVSLYVVDLARRGRLPATIAQRLAAIAAAHLEVGQASPTVHADVREVVAGVRRKLGTAPRHAKAPLAIEDLRAMVRMMPAGARGARDRCILLLGFASALRRSELSALDLADVRLERGGLVVMLRRSKTDQTGAGRELGIPRGVRRSTCPVRAYEAWLVERGHGPGPLFVQCDLNTGALSRRRLSGRGVAEVLKSAARRVGLDAARYGGHSLRAGCATAADGAGASAGVIMTRTLHKSPEMVQRYVRHGSLFDVDPLAGVL